MWIPFLYTNSKPALRGVSSTNDAHTTDVVPNIKTASRMGSLGHIIGYAMGAIDLIGVFGTRLGDTQFKQLTVIAAVGIIMSSAITCWAVTERVLVSGRDDPRRTQGRFKVFRQIWSTLLTLPPRIKGICHAVFWAWIAWFPFLVYSSTWVGEMYFRYDKPEGVAKSNDALGDMGRIGSTALTVYSAVTFISAWIMPSLIRTPEDKTFTHRPPASIAHWVEKLNKIKPDLLTAWVISHLVFAFAMFLTPFASSIHSATLIVAFCGIPWSLAQWAPTTFLGVEVNKLSGASDPSIDGLNGSAPYRRLSAGRLSMGSSIEMRDILRPDHSDAELGGAGNSTGELSGVYFGIMNIFTTLPQFIATFMSTVVFSILEPGKSPELATDAKPSEQSNTGGPNAIAVCMFIGAIAALAAAWNTSKLKHM